MKTALPGTGHFLATFHVRSILKNVNIASNGDTHVPKFLFSFRVFIANASSLSSIRGRTSPTSDELSSSGVKATAVFEVVKSELSICPGVVHMKWKMRCLGPAQETVFPSISYSELNSDELF
jgi:hypothetical protein